jgi:hypothetical protein
MSGKIGSSKYPANKLSALNSHILFTISTIQILKFVEQKYEKNFFSKKNSAKKINAQIKVQSLNVQGSRLWI